MGKWEMVRLGDVCVVLNGFAFQSKSYVADGYRVIRITNVQKGVIVDDDPKYYEQSPSLNKYELCDNDLLMSLTGNVGRVGLISASLLPAYLNQRVACLRVKGSSVLKEYLFGALNSDAFERASIDSAKGLAQKNMSTEWLKEYEIPLPPLSVQQQIADVLDRASALIEKRKAQIEKLDLLVKSQFIEMFGSFTNKTTLSHYIDALSAGKSLAGDSNCKNKVLKTGSVSYDYFDGTAVKDLPIDYDPLPEHLVKNGDVIISRMNTIELVGAVGYVWNVQINTFLPDRLWRAEINENANPVFVWQLLIREETKEAIRKIASGTSGSMKNISKKHFLKIPTIDVPLSLQTQFADSVEKVEAQKSLLQQSLAKLEQNYKSLMQKCFRGEIF